MLTRFAYFVEPHEKDCVVIFATHYFFTSHPRRAFLRVRYEAILCFENREQTWLARRDRGVELRHQRRLLRAGRVRLRPMTD